MGSAQTKFVTVYIPIASKRRRRVDEDRIVRRAYDAACIRARYFNGTASIGICSIYFAHRPVTHRDIVNACREKVLEAAKTVVLIELGCSCLRPFPHRRVDRILRRVKRLLLKNPDFIRFS